MVVALPSTHYISRRLLVAQSHLSDAKLWRIRLLRELCEGIKTIKFLASERRWEQAIAVKYILNMYCAYFVFPSFFF
jgi:hypothetical protein